MDARYKNCIIYTLVKISSKRKKQTLLCAYPNEKHFIGGVGNV